MAEANVRIKETNYFINNDLEYLKDGSSSSKYVTSTTRTKAAREHITRVQKDKGSMHMHATGNLHMMSTPKEELIRDFPRLNLCNIEDMLLLLVQKKLSNLDVDDRTVLHDIASSLKMDYLPKRHWSNLEKKRSRIMIKAIDKLLFKRRLMRNLDKFVGGRDYGNDLRLLERAI
nr:hypothetical protein [Tanacetum cinerariifolium]